MGDAVHQVLVQTAAEAVLGGGILCRGTALGAVDRHLAVYDLLDEFFGLVDAVIHPGEQHRLAVKAVGLHLFLGGDDDAVAICNFFFGQDVLGTVRTIGLHLGGQAQLVAGLGQGLGSHVGVSDAVDAGGHGQNAVAILGQFLLGKALGTKLCFLLRVDAVQKLCRGLCGFQLCHKVLVHQHLHHAGQHVHMQAAVFRRGDGKQQVGGAVILGVVLHGLCQPQGRQAGPGDHVGLGVGHRDAVVHIGGTFGLAGVQGFFVGFLVLDVAVGGLQFHQAAQDLFLIVQRLIQRDGLCGE